MLHHFNNKINKEMTTKLQILPLTDFIQCNRRNGKEHNEV